MTLGSIASAWRIDVQADLLIRKHINLEHEVNFQITGWMVNAHVYGEFDDA